MGKKVKNEKELAKAVHDEEVEIEMGDKLSKYVKKIKMTGDKAWAVAIVAIVAVVAMVILTAGTGGSSSFVTIPGAAAALVPAIVVLGASTAWAAVRIAVHAKSTDVLKAIRREYALKTVDGKKLLVRKK